MAGGAGGEDRLNYFPHPKGTSQPCVPAPCPRGRGTEAVLSRRSCAATRDRNRASTGGAGDPDAGGTQTELFALPLEPPLSPDTKR